MSTSTLKLTMWWWNFPHWDPNGHIKFNLSFKKKIGRPSGLSLSLCRLWAGLLRLYPTHKWLVPHLWEKCNQGAPVIAGTLIYFGSKTMAPEWVSGVSSSQLMPLASPQCLVFPVWLPCIVKSRMWERVCFPPKGECGWLDRVEWKLVWLLPWTLPFPENSVTSLRDLQKAPISK